MSVLVNGVDRVVADGTTLRDLIAEVAGTLRGSAAAVDGEVVPRSAWDQFPVRDGQRIELITAVQGG